MQRRIPLFIVSLFFFVGGIAHFTSTEIFILAVPDYFDNPRELVIISGVFELLGAIGILLPKFRLIAGYGLIALSAAVFPANIHMALHPERYSNFSEIVLYLRLPFQFLIMWFIWWAIKFTSVYARNTD